MAARLRAGDVINYAVAYRGNPRNQTGVVIGHPHFSGEHDVVAIAPVSPQPYGWKILNDDWCSLPIGRDPALARMERKRLYGGELRQKRFLQRLPRGWMRP